MATGTVSLRYFILGLLARQTMSGYDIRRLLKSLSWLIGSPSSGSLYPILHSLLQEGLTTMEVIPSTERPPRKIYSITEAGRQALQAWLDRPVESNATLKAFVMRLLLVGSHSQPGLKTHLQRRRAQVADHQVALGEITGSLNAGTDLGQHLALRYGLALAAAELEWLDSTLESLSESPPPEEDVQSEGTVSAIRGIRSPD